MAPPHPPVVAVVAVVVVVVVVVAAAVVAGVDSEKAREAVLCVMRANDKVTQR